MRILLAFAVVMSFAVPGCKGDDKKDDSKKTDVKKNESNKTDDKKNESKTTDTKKGTPAETKKDSTGDKPTSSTSDGDKVESPATKDDPKAKAKDADAACITKCVQANQMRAVSADQIDRDCRAQCAKK